MHWYESTRTNGNFAVVHRYSLLLPIVVDLKQQNCCCASVLPVDKNERHYSHILLLNLLQTQAIMNISPLAVNRLTSPSPLNPYFQHGMHRYMVAEQGNIKHWIELYGPHLDKGSIYQQHVLYGDLGDVSTMFLWSSCWNHFSVLMARGTYGLEESLGGWDSASFLFSGAWSWWMTSMPGFVADDRKANANSRLPKKYPTFL